MVLTVSVLIKQVSDRSLKKLSLSMGTSGTSVLSRVFHQTVGFQRNSLISRTALRGDAIREHEQPR